MGFVTHEQQEKMMQAARLEGARKTCIAESYARHQDWVRCIGNDRLILEKIEAFYGPEVVPTASMLDDCLALNPDDAKDFARRPEEVHRQQLSEDIIGLLRAKGRSHDDYTLESERRRHATMSLPDLRARLAAIRESHRLAAQPLSVHRQTLVDQRPKYALPELPRELHQDGRLVALSSEAIRRMNPVELRRLNRIYGEAAVNARLAGR